MHFLCNDEGSENEKLQPTHKYVAKTIELARNCHITLLLRSPLENPVCETIVVQYTAGSSIEVLEEGGHLGNKEIGELT